MMAAVRFQSPLFPRNDISFRTYIYTGTYPPTSFILIMEMDALWKAETSTTLRTSTRYYALTSESVWATNHFESTGKQ
jgi:hypothetical protein